jgi:hypothetical protein
MGVLGWQNILKSHKEKLSSSLDGQSWDRKIIIIIFVITKNRNRGFEARYCTNATAQFQKKSQGYANRFNLLKPPFFS